MHDPGSSAYGSGGVSYTLAGATPTHMSYRSPDGPATQGRKESQSRVLMRGVKDRMITFEGIAEWIAPDTGARGPI